MKRIILLFVIFSAMLIMTVSFGREAPPVTEVKLYFTDMEIFSLIPRTVQIPKTDTEGQAKLVIRKLIEGDDENLKIRRTIPKIPNCMSVSVEDGIAYVDIKRSMIQNHADGRDVEILTVYSIVNSLMSIDGINNVRFTICGKVKKDFMGYIDMRETFIPDYAA